MLRRQFQNGMTRALFANGNCMNFKLCVLIIARTNLRKKIIFIERALKQFCVNCSGAFQKVLCYLEFTVIPRLKCFGRVLFRLPLMNIHVTTENDFPAV